MDSLLNMTRIDSQIMSLHLCCPRYELSPALPLWTLVPLLERRLVGLPAAVLVVEPEANETNPFLHVGQPVGCDVDAASYSAWATEGRIQDKDNNIQGEQVLFYMLVLRCANVY